MYYEMFPPVIQELQAEIQHHPALLVNLLQLPKDSPMELKLGEVAAFCGIILDGLYDEEEVLQLCEKLIWELKRARQELVIEVVPANGLPPH